MENPMFRMEGVVKTKDDMADFEGPLTLLLQLLGKNKIEIADIQISQLLDQYMDYLGQMKRMDLEVASEFVQMASHLVYIKTKALLGTEEEVPELELLIQSMEALQRKDSYTQIKSVAGSFSEMSRRGEDYTPGPPEYRAADTKYLYRHSAGELLTALEGLLEKTPDNDGLREHQFVMPARIIYSVTDKTREILGRAGGGQVCIRELFLGSRSRSELVATFIAVLELCKMGRICFEEEEDGLVVRFVG